MTRDARLSPDGVYRYTLTRRWEAYRPTALWVMLNPSTADALVDDPTIRRCIGFARSWGFGAIQVVNLYALRSTDPSALKYHDAPEGPMNRYWLSVALAETSMTVAAWGANPLAQERGRELMQRSVLGPDVKCLGTTKAGAPRHPLYVSRSTEPQPYRPFEDVDDRESA